MAHHAEKLMKFLKRRPRSPSIPSDEPTPSNNETSLGQFTHPTSDHEGGLGLFSGAQNFSITNTFMVDGFHVNNCVSHKHIVFESLEPYTCLDATKDSSARYPPPRCHPDTQLKIRERLAIWLSNEHEEQKMLWVRGSAGTGKSAVAQSFGDACEEDGNLGGSYFFSRVANRNKFETVVPTLVYQLAENDPEYRNLVGHRLAETPLLLRKAPPIQFRKLIAEPFANLERRCPQRRRPIAIILDGLDECEGEDAQLEIVEMITNTIRSYPDLSLHWLIFSRPEAHLIDAFSCNLLCGREELIIDVECQENIKDRLTGVKDTYQDVTPIDCPSEQASPSELSQTKQRLSAILLDQEKREALLELRGDRAQSCIDTLNNLVSGPEIRKSTEPGLLKHTLIILQRLCEASMLYPTCYVLKDIHDISLRRGGGFGDIYQGRYKRQLLCLKVARVYEDSDIKQLLKALAREAIVWNQLDHLNVVPFYGIFYWEQRICLVSPWMENGDIVQFLKKHNISRKPLIDDIAKGLQYLHEQNIVHGDLKGRNVLIDDRQRACLADFGLCSIITNGTLGITRSTSGPSGNTTRWTSPELFEAEGRPTCGSDVWAFGCLCYEILTGMEPFEKCSDYQATYKLMRGELPAQLDTVRLHEDEYLNNKFRDLIGICWSIEVGKRPQCPTIVDQLEADSLTRPFERVSIEMPHRVWLNPSDPTTNLRQLKDLLSQDYQRTGVNNVEDVDPSGAMPGSYPAP